MWVRPKIIQQHEDPGDYHGSCGGRDKLLDDKCTCPDPLYTLQFRALTGQVFYRELRCTCCGLPFYDKDRPLAGPPD